MAALARGDLAVRVPTCPDWDLRELLVHTGKVHRWQTEAARHDAGAFPDMDRLEAPPGPDDDVGAWFQRGVDEAVRVMSELDGTERRWTWFPPDQTAGWYFRRITQETLVHRIDAELAAGEPVSDVDPVLAVDGVDEMCDVFIPAAEGQAIGGDGRTLHLHATDADGEWLLTLHPDRVAVERGHAKGDAAVRGRAVDLLFLVWGRDPLGEIETFGDESVIATFRAATRS